jgi:uncharacterized protein (DUF885 family)
MALSELAALADRYWDHVSAFKPTEAFIRGDHRFAGEIEDLTRAHEDEAIGELQAIVVAARNIEAGALTATEKVTREVLIHQAGSEAEELVSRRAEIDVNPVMGFQVTLASAAAQYPVSKPEHALAVVDRYRKVATMIDEAIKRLRQGVARDRTPPAVAVQKTIAQLDGYLAMPVGADLHLQVRRPEAFTADQEAAWRNELLGIVQESLRPAYKAYRDALAEEILPHARPPERSGVVWLPDGEEVYARAVAQHTTIDTTPMEIHRIGKEAIAGLADEYREFGGRMLGTTDLATIFGRLRNDPGLRFSDSEAVRVHARNALQRAEAAIPEWFGILPQAPCVVVDIPEEVAKDATIAYYVPPATDGSRPGSYYLNVSEPATRTIFESEALAFHESIPGHHLQIAIAQEQADLPEFRRHTWITAFGEGWALYTERLSDEMGLYSGDLERLGILSFDSWRAGRLVVDTGIHALGWSRQEAIDYLLDNSPLAPNNIETEVDRYIGWPGQALAYKTGQLEIQRLRSAAEAELGSAFDLRAFHDVVLGSGGVTLPVLRRLVGEWVVDRP